MTTYQTIDGGVCAPQGFTAAGMHCGVRKNHAKKDIAMIFSKTPCAASGCLHPKQSFWRAHYRDAGKSAKRHGAGGNLQQRKRQYLQCRRR